MLLKGAKQKIKSKHKNPIRIAQNEVKMGIIDYEIIRPKKEEVIEPEEQIFVAEDIGEEREEEKEGLMEEAELEEEEEPEAEIEEEVEEEAEEESEEEEEEKEEED